MINNVEGCICVLFAEGATVLYGGNCGLTFNCKRAAHK